MASWLRHLDQRLSGRPWRITAHARIAATSIESPPQPRRLRHSKCRCPLALGSAGTRSSPPSAPGGWEVYRARDTRLEREVAVKVLSRDLTSSQIARERFQREARTIAALHHPHICAIYDVGETPARALAASGDTEGPSCIPGHPHALEAGRPGRSALEAGASRSSKASLKGVLYTHHHLRAELTTDREYDRRPCSSWWPSVARRSAHW